MSSYSEALVGPDGPLHGIDMDALPEVVRQHYLAFPYEAHMLEAYHAAAVEQGRAYVASLTSEQLAVRNQQIREYLGNVAV